MRTLSIVEIDFVAGGDDEGGGGNFASHYASENRVETQNSFYVGGEGGFTGAFDSGTGFASYTGTEGGGWYVTNFDPVQGIYATGNYSGQQSSGAESWSSAIYGNNGSTYLGGAATAGGDGSIVVTSTDGTRTDVHTLYQE
jgi:hypothetical protein